MGKIRLRAWLQTDKYSDQELITGQIINYLPRVTNYEEWAALHLKPLIYVPPTDTTQKKNSTKDGGTYEASNKTTNKTKVDWDGKKVQEGPWYDKELFTIWGAKFTAKEVGGISGGLLAVIIITVLVCLYCSWRKREAIAEGARRASTFISAMGTSIRRSIIGGPQNAYEGESVQPSPRDLTRDPNQRNFLKDLFAFHNEAENIKS